MKLYGFVEKTLLPTMQKSEEAGDPGGSFRVLRGFFEYMQSRYTIDDEFGDELDDGEQLADSL